MVPALVLFVLFGVLFMLFLVIAFIGHFWGLCCDSSGFGGQPLPVSPGGFLFDLSVNLSIGTSKFVSVFLLLSIVVSFLIPLFVFLSLLTSLPSVSSFSSPLA